MTERIDIVVREDGSREVARRIATIGTSASAASIQVKNLNLSLAAGSASKAVKTQAQLSKTMVGTAVATNVAAGAQVRATRSTVVATRATANAVAGQTKLSNSIRNTAQAYTIVDGPLGATAGRLRAISTAFSSLNPVLVAAGLGVAALTFGIGALLRVGGQSEQQLARISGVIRATGGAAGLTTDSINKLAQEIGRSTLASVAGVREASAVLLTFRSIAGDAFGRTLRLAQDMAAVFGGDIKSATLQLAKALEDPIQGITQLRRVGVIFSQDQKDVIKALQETGNSAAAQAIIFEELDKQVGKAGLAEGTDTLAGAIDLLKENFTELIEVVAQQTDITGNASGAFSSLANFVSGLTGAVNDLSDAMDSLPSLSTDTFIGRLVNDANGAAGRILDFIPIIGNIRAIARAGEARTAQANEEATAQTKVNESFQNRNELLKEQARLLATVSSSVVTFQTGSDVPQISQGTGDRSLLAPDQLEQITLVELKLKALDELVSKGLFTDEIEIQISTAGSKEAITSLLVQAERTAELFSGLQRDLDKIAVDSARSRIEAVRGVERQAAQDSLNLVEAQVAQRNALFEGKLQDDQIAAEQRLNSARLQSIAQGFDAENAVIRNNLSGRVSLIEQQGALEVQGIKEVAAAKLAATITSLEGETSALKAALAQQDQIIQEQDAARAKSRSIGDKVDIDPAKQQGRQKAEGEILAIRTKMVGIEQQIASARDTADIELATQLQQAQLETQKQSQALQEQRQSLLVSEANEARSILDASKSRVTVLQDQLVELRRIRGTEAAIAAGLTDSDFARAIKQQTQELADELRNQNKIIVKFGEETAQGLQGAFADFFFDPFEDGLRGLALSIVDTIRRSASEAAAAHLFEDLFGGRDSQNQETQGALGSGGLGQILTGLLPTGKGAEAAAQEVLAGGKDIGTSASQPVYVQQVGALPINLGEGLLGGEGGSVLSETIAAGVAGGATEGAAAQEQVNSGFLQNLGGVFGGFKDGLGSVFNSVLGGFQGLFASIGGLFGGSGGGGGGGASGLFGAVAGAFGGGFASGGVLGAGKFGIVGEGGKPELLSSGASPVRITPLDGLSGSSGGNSARLERMVQELVTVTKSKDLNVVNVNEQDPAALLATLSTRDGSRVQRNFVTTNQRQVRRDLGVR